MTVSAYEDMGKLHGAIGKRAESLLAHSQRKDGVNIKADLETIFEALVTVDIKGKAFRRRARRNELQAVDNLVEELISGRLLIGAKFKDDSGEYATVELADEALCDTWPRLEEWIARNRSEMVLWAELEHHVGKWRQTHDNNFLWRGRKFEEAKRLFRCWSRHLQSSDITLDDIRQFISASASRRRKSTIFIVAGVFVGVIPLGMLIWFFLTPKETMPVGSFPENDFHLFDVLGNAWEWTKDCLTSSPDGSAPPASLKVCLARGGSWDNYEEWKVHPAYQLPLKPNHRAKSVGFRVVSRHYAALWRVL